MLIAKRLSTRSIASLSGKEEQRNLAGKPVRLRLTKTPTSVREDAVNDLPLSLVMHSSDSLIKSKFKAGNKGTAEMRE